MPPVSAPALPLALCFLSCLLASCVTTQDMPPWFDSFQRRPIKTVTVQGHRIAYLDEGQGSPVILVHGFGGSMWQWEYQQAALSATHRLITLDLLGSGLSDKPDIDYTPEEMVAFLTAFMDALDLSRASLVGNSMGGALVIGMTLAHPERVDRLVLIGGLPDHVQEKLTGRLTKRAIQTDAPVWLIRLGNWLLGRGVTEAVLKEIVYDQSRLTPAVIERAYRNRQRPGLIPPLMAQARALPLWEEGFAKRLRDIGRPTLVLWGAEDQVFPPQVGQDMASVIPGSTFELLLKAGHIPQWERPDLVNPLLLRFLQ
ncbi:MAG: alpha/beta fold hydrolase [Nitrospira sp.]|nr:alpha/beta fold hydrolase [Nitrospira sp.]